jgi:hypothetical protein
MGEMTTIYEWMYERCQELTLTNVAGMLHTTWPKAYKWLARVTSANITNLTKISAFNQKQLSNNIIDPLFLWYLQVGSVKQGRATEGKVSKFMR